MSEVAAPGTVGPGAGVTRVLSDDRLARRAARGDERAFAAIFDRYHQSLYRYCATIVGDPQDAQDALQNTMVKVLRALPGEERKLELRPWLYRIAHNESVELLRRRRETRPLEAELASPGVGLAEEVTARDRLRRLISDLDQLPERQRGALVMRELAGLDFAEIGAALGTSPAVARQTLYEARLGLQKMDEGRAMSCRAVTKALSDGDGRVGRRRDLRAHLRACASCRRFREEIEGRERDLAALAPLPAVAAAGLLHGLLSGHGVGAGGGGLAGAIGGGAAKTLGGSVALKGAATVAAVAAIGVGAADRGGLVDVGPLGDGASKAPPSRVETASPPAAAAGHAGGPATGAGGAHPGSSQAVVPGGAPGAAGGGSQSEGTESVAHPHGRGHEKQHPSASAHGQQTAASHKAGGRGATGQKRHPAHPAKPPHPAHPPNPGAGKAPASPQPDGAAPEKAQPEGNTAEGSQAAKEPSPE